MSQYNLLYHSVDPDATNPNGYTSFDTLDFTLDFSQRALVAGTVRVEADMEILTGGAPLLTQDRVACDHMIGGHAFFQSAVTTTLAQGVIENSTFLPRYVKMKTSCTETADDMNNSKYVCELRSSDVKIQETLMRRKCISDYGGGKLAGTDLPSNTAQGTARRQTPGHLSSAFLSVSDGSDTGSVVQPLTSTANGADEGAGYALGTNPEFFPLPDFSIKPHICLNQPVGGSGLINYSTTGTIRVSLNLARAAEALYGPDVLATTSYVLRNVRVCYVTVPEPPSQQPVSLRTTLCLKSALNSQLSNTSNRVPAVCDSVALSFIPLSRENSLNHNNTALELLPNVSRLQFMFNDSTSRYISYELKHSPEIVAEGLKAMSVGTGSNNVRLDTLAANKGYVAGLSFGEAIDLSQQKFNIGVESQVLNTEPYTMFSYFSSVVSM